jgi:hypothetical protein
VCIVTIQKKRPQYSGTGRTLSKAAGSQRREAMAVARRKRLSLRGYCLIVTTKRGELLDELQANSQSRVGRNGRYIVMQNRVVSRAAAHDDGRKKSRRPAKAGKSKGRPETKRLSATDIALEDALLHINLPLDLEYRVPWTGTPVDRGTSGCMIWAKSDPHARPLGGEFFLRRVKRHTLPW